jgi:hypothetical protein
MHCSGVFQGLKRNSQEEKDAAQNGRTKPMDLNIFQYFGNLYALYKTVLEMVSRKTQREKETL